MCLFIFCASPLSASLSTLLIVHIFLSIYLPYSSPATDFRAHWFLRSVDQYVASGHYKNRALFPLFTVSLSLPLTLLSSLFYTLLVIFLLRFVVFFSLDVVSVTRYKWLSIYSLLDCLLLLLGLLFFSSQINDQYSKQTHISTWQVINDVFTFTKNDCSTMVDRRICIKIVFKTSIKRLKFNL